MITYALKIHFTGFVYVKLNKGEPFGDDKYIVPIYNVEQYLSECIESIINQTYKELEIILIDDGSTDRSGEVVDEYTEQDSRIKVVHQENTLHLLIRMTILR
jgi:cellulose synthase/poly-beta-1,6-N-acetylglucosamine synthase-like glycosyltransferase